ncbi:MAG: hypothetical protein P0120_19215 [Nitrospira sp.]|nr:hypothetical protein [Nitrospira sp.]
MIELFRRMGAAQVINDQVRLKQQQRGLPPAQLVERLLGLWRAGGDRCQDLKTLGTDAALAILVGEELSAATTIRDFLEAFHVEHLPLWRAGEKTAVPAESAPLAGLGLTNQGLLAAMQVEARGFFDSTVGINETTIRQYVRHQGERETSHAQLEL